MKHSVRMARQSAEGDSIVKVIAAANDSSLGYKGLPKLKEAVGGSISPSARGLSAEGSCTTRLPAPKSTFTSVRLKQSPRPDDDKKKAAASMLTNYGCTPEAQQVMPP